jgi:hypothetical protein
MAHERMKSRRGGESDSRLPRTPFQDLADAGDGNSANAFGYAGLSRCCEEQFVVFAAVESLF